MVENEVVESRFFDVVRAQRACRSFRDEPVPEALITRVLTAATYAPSAENRQPWVFVVVRDVDGRRAVGALTQRAWEGGARSYSEGRLPPGLLADVDQGATGGIGAAPVLVVVAGDTTLTHPSALASSVFPAVQNLLLAAGAVGLGSALTTLALSFGEELAELLGMPATIRPLAVVPLGWPARPLGLSRREPIETKAHDGRYGHPWPGASPT